MIPTLFNGTHISIPFNCKNILTSLFLIVYKKHIPLTTLSSYHLLRKSFPTLKSQELLDGQTRENFSAFKLMKLLTTKSNFFLFYCVKGEDVYFET